MRRSRSSAIVIRSRAPAQPATTPVVTPLDRRGNSARRFGAATVTAMDDDAAILRLITVYSQLLDDGRWDEWGELFTEDAVFAVWGNVHRGRAEIVEAISGMQPERPGKHVAFATVVDVAGDEAL